ncbi:MAG: hypothetical protein HY360_11695 [Verrucomicrobia bacterium]|nr:hypothetical protein [Verrucomicrobiota bacterium]
MATVLHGATRACLGWSAFLFELGLFATGSAVAASVVYPTAGNLRPEAGSVEIWFELPFDARRLKPAELWIPSMLFRLTPDEGSSEMSLLLRFQSLPDILGKSGELVKQGMRGLCSSPKGGAEYIPYEDAGIHGNRPHHLAYTWEHDVVWLYADGRQIAWFQPGVRGDSLVDPLFHFDPYASVICLGSRYGPQLVRLYALRISNVPLKFSPMEKVKPPQANPVPDVNVLLFDDFSRIEKAGRGQAVTMPAKQSRLTDEGNGKVVGEWSEGASSFGHYLGLYPADTSIERLLPANASLKASTQRKEP